MIIFSKKTLPPFSVALPRLIYHSILEQKFFKRKRKWFEFTNFWTDLGQLSVCSNNGDFRDLEFTL